MENNTVKIDIKRLNAAMADRYILPDYLSFKSDYQVWEMFRDVAYQYDPKIVGETEVTLDIDNIYEYAEREGLPLSYVDQNALVSSLKHMEKVSHQYGVFVLKPGSLIRAEAKVSIDPYMYICERFKKSFDPDMRSCIGIIANKMEAGATTWIKLRGEIVKDLNPNKQYQILKDDTVNSHKYIFERLFPQLGYDTAIANFNKFLDDYEFDCNILYEVSLEPSLRDFLPSAYRNYYSRIDSIRYHLDIFPKGYKHEV